MCDVGTERDYRLTVLLGSNSYGESAMKAGENIQKSAQLTDSRNKSLQKAGTIRRHKRTPRAVGIRGWVDPRPSITQTDRGINDRGITDRRITDRRIIDRRIIDRRISARWLRGVTVIWSFVFTHVSTQMFAYARLSG